LFLFRDNVADAKFQTVGSESNFMQSAFLCTSVRSLFGKSKCMDEIVSDLRRRADGYILQSDEFYADLICPFILLKDPTFDTDISHPPLPSYLEAGFAIPDDALPPDLFEL
jgi:hypothetical protein